MRWHDSRSCVLRRLLLLALVLAFSSSPLQRGGDHACSFGIGVVYAHASKLPGCARLGDIINYGVNPVLLQGANTYYLDSQYFCASTAPAQYQCSCTVSSTCKPQSDPWGRNIGVCDCCPPWMIVCFVIMGSAFLVAVLCSVYSFFCRGCWWCDGYVVPSPALLPRRGPAVSCPPDQLFPPNLFRGYMSDDFINVEATADDAVDAGGHHGSEVGQN